jgi:hypothetical protein
MKASGSAGGNRTIPPAACNPPPRSCCFFDYAFSNGLCHPPEVRMRWMVLCAFLQVFLAENTGACCDANGADVVFILDNSASMWSHAATIDTVLRDTSFWSSSGKCLTAASPDSLRYSVQENNWQMPNQSLVKSLKLLPQNQSSCREYSGDPYNARGMIIRNAIDYLAQTSPTSTAGVMGFANAVDNAQTLLQLNDPANVTQIKSMVRLDSLPSTNYGPPLQLAKEWLTDPTRIKTRKQAIIFISDGIPSDGNAVLNLVDAAMPPIYSIFLGRHATADTAMLAILSNQSGGSFSRIDPSHPAAMNSVMSAIIQQVVTSVIHSSKFKAHQIVRNDKVDAMGRTVGIKKRSIGTSSSF